MDIAALATTFPRFVFCSVVCDLDLTLDLELTYALHIHVLSRVCYYQLHQLLLARLLLLVLFAVLSFPPD